MVCPVLQEWFARIDSMRCRFRPLWVVVLACSVGLIFALTTSCSRAPEPEVAKKSSASPPGTQQVFKVKGVVVSLSPREKTIQIKHEAIPNYMMAMTMPFDVKDTNEMKGLAPGDPVAFRLTVTDTEGWIDQIQKILVVTNPVTPPSPITVIRNVQRLQVGDALPEYHFTNQFGQAFSTENFKGQAIAITFLFTRCPYPTFCPRMANNFEEVQQQLLSVPNMPTNWHLLTISFDPEFDKPEVLKGYAEMHKYNPDFWTFATGSLAEVTTLGEQFGLSFWRENASISHNLRTIVLDPTGKVQKIFEGNVWTGAELAGELKKAAEAK